MIDTMISRRARDLGGFTVGRVLPYAGGQMVGPFIFFDHMGPAEFAKNLPKTADVRPHPHIGLSTVTYLFDGEIMHRDSVGSEQPIAPGAVNWMIAGRGITHSERFEKARREGDTLHGIQAWVALPEDHEEIAPAFFHHPKETLPAWNEGGARLRLIAGNAFDLRAPVKTHSPLFYIHAEMDAGAKIAVPDGFSERAAYVAKGVVEAGGRRITEGEMPVFTRGKSVTLTATMPAVVMLLGGEPIGHRFIEWNFVSSSKDRIEVAKADWRAGRMKLPDSDNEEFTPLPG